MKTDGVVQKRKRQNKVERMKKLKVRKKKILAIKSKMEVLRHLSRRNCVLLPYLDDKSLHTLGEFIFNVITQRVKLDNNQLKKVKKILEKDKNFYKKLVDVKTDDPMGYFRNTLKSNPQVEQGIVSLIAALAPLISSLILR